MVKRSDYISLVEIRPKFHQTILPKEYRYKSLSLSSINIIYSFLFSILKHGLIKYGFIKQPLN